jgi:hypothetical protein
MNTSPASQSLAYDKWAPDPFPQYFLLNSILPFIKDPEAALTSANAFLHGSTIGAIRLKMLPEEKPQILPRVPPCLFVGSSSRLIGRFVFPQVSSFDTISKPAAFKGDTCHEGGTPAQRAQASRDRLYEQLKGHMDPKRHHLLDSALRRDLTING